jgi:hypothetical protein
MNELLFFLYTTNKLIIKVDGHKTNDGLPEISKMKNRNRNRERLYPVLSIVKKKMNADRHIFFLAIQLTNK